MRFATYSSNGDKKKPLVSKETLATSDEDAYFAEQVLKAMQEKQIIYGEAVGGSRNMSIFLKQQENEDTK